MKFSIVVATYNRKEKLKKCIESILSQKYENFELLVVDDGSTDGTKNMIAEFSDKRVRYYQLDKNYGTATPARNKGIDMMTGDALIIWDSDDYLLPNALETINSGFVEYDGIDIVCTSTNFVSDGATLDLKRIDSSYLSAKDWFGGKRPRDAEIIAIKRNLIGSVRFESRGIDFMFYAKIIGSTKCKIYYVNETCGIVNLESDSLSLTKARRKKDLNLSIERSVILDSFLEEYGYLYIESGRQEKYSGFALGSGAGYLKDKNYKKAIEMLGKANKYNFDIRWKILELSLLVPGVRYLLYRFSV